MASTNYRWNFDPWSLKCEEMKPMYIKSLQVCMLSHFSCVQLFVTPMGCSQWRSSVDGISKARILDWVAVPSFRESSKPRVDSLVFPAFKVDSLPLGASQVVLVIKSPPSSAGDMRDMGSIPGSRKSLGGEHGNPLQYPCLMNPMVRGAWRATVHGIT